MDKIINFKQSSPSVKSLASSDPRMGRLIEHIGDYSLRLRTNYTASIARTIAGQQISAQVARKIWGRVLTLCEDITPESLLSVSPEDLRSTGLSRSKVLYIREFCQKVIDSEIRLDHIGREDNEEIIRQLITVKGIGRWTAKMFLIFSLGKPDVLAEEDIGIRRSIKWLYSLPDLPTAGEVLDYGERWKPYRSVASLYLWEAINSKLINKSNYSRA